MAEKQRVLRISFYSKRKPGMTEDEFHKHWSETHAVLAGDWLARHGILKYTQLHTPASMKSVGLSGIPQLDQMSWFEYDGVAEFWTTDIKCFYNACQDPYYHQYIAPDEAGLFDFQNHCWSVGWEEVYVKDGKMVGLAPVENEGLTSQT